MGRRERFSRLVMGSWLARRIEEAREAERHLREDLYLDKTAAHGSAVARLKAFLEVQERFDLR